MEAVNPLIGMGKAAKAAASKLGVVLSRQKDEALLAIADLLEENVDKIIAANQLDLEAAVEAGLTTAMQDRLLLNKERIFEMAAAVRQVAALPDPVGVVLDGGTRPNGLQILRKTVPLGVIGLIYESRPNVTVDCAVLCLKAGNACILRGGSEAIHSNRVLASVVQQGLAKGGLPPEAVQLIGETDRAYSTALMQLVGYVDALIPRGGQGLIQSVVKNSAVPVIETGAGLCHLYVEEQADLTMAIEILDNAKTSRPSVCNAVETLLVHEKIAEKFLPMVADRLGDRVELRGCARSLPLLGSKAVAANAEDWATEYDDYILAVKVVGDTEEALEHIEVYSTGHSETIVTEDYHQSELFLARVDAATVYVNASSRFTDGGEFGLGAEIGISTQKLHVRGPMGLTALTSYKYLVRGSGQVR